MTDNIYLRQDGRLVEMSSEPYDNEDLLQALLAQHPDLLSGGRPDDSEPRRWLLVRREAGIPDAAGAADRWSADHLFLDQDGVPTLVEVKRSSDTRIRREVVGQMLDYAANAVVHWPVERIQDYLRERARQHGTTDEDLLSELLGAEADVGAFWADVKKNLESRRVRMIFVSDKIPAELGQIVEFLNDQMDRAEMLAVEVQQYRGAGMQVLVPRLIGQTYAARSRKGPGDPGPWNPVFREIAKRFNSLGTALHAREDTRARSWFQVTTGQPNVHYEWFPRARQQALAVALHLESSDRELNMSRIERLRPRIEAAARKAGCESHVGEFGRSWASGELLIDMTKTPEAEMPEVAASAMAILVQETLLELRQILGEPS